VLLLWYLWPFLVEGDTFPLGPDAPVYLWWTRLAGVEGLSAVGSRPGVPALALVLAGSFGLSVIQVTAALEVAFGVGLGLASFAVARRGGVAAGALAGVLAGTFGVHLAAGYLSNLSMAAAFVAAIALLDRPTNRAAIVAGLVLAGSGLAHPQFFVVGMVILGAAAVVAWRSDRGETLRVAGAALGGGAVLVAGLFAVQIGPAPPDVDTSRDAFLRRAGLLSELRSAYLDRFVHRWTRYVQWLSAPLAMVGFGSPSGTAGRILRAWFVVTVAGVALALVTGWLPPDRFITFGFAIPILAAFGVVRVWRWLQQRRALGFAVTGAMVIAMLAGSWIAWNRQEAFISEEEITAVGVANEMLGELDRDIPLAFIVDDNDPTMSFLATRAGNVVRASVAPERIRDVVVVVPAFQNADRERRALERISAEDLEEAERRTGKVATTIRLSQFDSSLEENGVEIEVGTEDAAGDLRVETEPLEPLTPLDVAFASVATLALFLVAGFGWARVGIDDRVMATAAAPAIGAGVLILAAVALDAVGVAIGEAPGALAASALGGGGGYVAWLILERRSRARPAPQVHEQPAE
jgi:hypothetical protein